MRTTSDIKLGHVRVGDAMHHGILTCEKTAPLRDAARLMAQQHVHALAVELSGETWGMLSALDVVAGAAAGGEMSAGEAAATEFLSVDSGARLEHAAQMMLEHEVSHLTVIDHATGRPIGMLSTLDIAAVYGG